MILKKGGGRKGKRFRSGTSYKDALQMLDKRIKAANALNNDAQRLASLVFADFTRGIWADYLQRRRVKASTVYSYDSMLKNLVLPKWGTLALPDITVEHVTKFFKGLEKDYSTKYVLNVYALLNVMFEVAKDHDLISDIPLRAKIHRPQCQPKKKVALKPEQLRQILDEVGEDYRPLFLTAMITGARLGEVRGLRWQDLDAGEGKLRIQCAVWRQLLQTPKTEASVRTLHIPRELVDVLCLTESNQSGLLRMTSCLRGQMERLTMPTTCAGWCCIRQWIVAESRVRSGVMDFMSSGTRREASYTRRPEI